ncbi:contact-dependent growth inhibition system immunity protein [Marinactinospora thermotolerans]|uniref:contact-dependent growth inhibition system immunity protein n=1 Tax=Marinactinospora thermotolerans TaxID=531310 RepID=UPI003D8FBADE
MMYEYLRKFFAGGMHQDWDLDGDSLEEIFRKRHVNALDESRRILHEIEMMLSSDLSEEEIDHLVTIQWSSGYEPDEDTETWRGVLRDMIGYIHDMHPELADGERREKE